MATADRVHDGNTYVQTATTTVTRNTIAVVGGRVGVAQQDGVSGDAIAYAITGTYVFPCASASTFASGASVYWDGTVATATASGNTWAGMCEGQSTSSQNFVSVRLTEP